MTLDELIDQVVDDRVPLTSVLLKAKVLAYNLRSDSLKAWLEGEINGYTGSMVMPEYRRDISVQSVGTFTDGMTAVVNNHLVPLSLLSDDLRDFAERIDISLSISGVQGLIEGRAGDNIQAAWPSDMVTMLNYELREKGERGGYMDARRQIGRASLHAILDNARNRLLTFLMELREQYPDLDISKRSADPDTNQTAQVLVTNYIYGDNNTVGSGRNFAQTVTQAMSNMPALLAHLEELGVGEEDRETLEQAVVADQQSGHHGIGDNVKAWLGNFTAGVASSHVATNLPQIIAAIATFMGQ
jgi:hypothetical protein